MIRVSHNEKTNNPSRGVSSGAALNSPRQKDTGIPCPLQGLGLGRSDESVDGGRIDQGQARSTAQKRPVGHGPPGHVGQSRLKPHQPQGRMAFARDTVAKNGVALDKDEIPDIGRAPDDRAGQDMGRSQTREPAPRVSDWHRPWGWTNIPRWSWPGYVRLLDRPDAGPNSNPENPIRLQSAPGVR
jgi:hypothetical protein